MHDTCRRYIPVSFASISEKVLILLLGLLHTCTITSLRTFSQLLTNYPDTNLPSGQPTQYPANVPSQIPNQHQYPFPTPIYSQWTANIQQAATSNITQNEGVSAPHPTFDQLKAIYSQQQFVKDLGKFNSDNPKRQAQLSFANLRENRAARRDLAALHAARSHMYGEREFGFKS